MTYADNSTVTKTYDAFNRLFTETSARGIVKTHSYETARGLLLSTSYSDGTTTRSYTYNHLSQLTREVDDAGTRNVGYNAWAEPETDSLAAGDETHLITELRDELGRSSGYTYKLNNVEQQSVNYGYGADGRLSTAGFEDNGENKSFTYGYLAGSNLLHTLTMPNGITLTQQYETQRDLLTSMAYTRGETSVAERTYSYDTLGRPTVRTETREGDTTRNDAFTHNDRSELTAATLGNAAYAYAYDNIGNRKTAQENAEEATNYDANVLNQYTAVGSFTPTYDAAGNQTLVQTCTGIWTVVYNAENRPVTFTRANEDGTSTKVSCSYDYMGRRATKKVETIAADSTATTMLHHRYLYRGYLQVACCDLMESGNPCRWFLTWDPTQPVATRPLAIRKDGTWYCYGWDLTKNICELFSTGGTILTTYSYSPYGTVTAEGSAEQGIQWSSEYHDPELALVYYNYRHYNPMDGRWAGRDLAQEGTRYNLFLYDNNNVLLYIDKIGLTPFLNDADWGGMRYEDDYQGKRASRGNCYRYAFNDPDSEAQEHHQQEPYRSGVKGRQNFNCKKLSKGLPDQVKPSNKKDKCPECYYKILMVVRRGGKYKEGKGVWKLFDSDFHFYRQNANGLWSHKPGWHAVISNIEDPVADAKIKHYEVVCGYYCVPDGGVDVDKPRKKGNKKSKQTAKK